MNWFKKLAMGTKIIAFLLNTGYSALNVESGYLMIYDSKGRDVNSIKFTVLIDNYPNGTFNAPWGFMWKM
ncbi:MAG: hypothetical protein ACFFCQ_17765 [Promethearchaeota archaeon]